MDVDCVIDDGIVGSFVGTFRRFATREGQMS